MKLLKYVGKVIFITLLIVFVLRCFFFESFSISTSQMESSLMQGDEVLVSKISYGPRLPITPLSIPFMFDKFYSDLIELPYIRLFPSDILRNDVVLFNSPLKLETPIDKRSLLISRCVAIPGDTILISDGIYYINGQQYVHSPSQVDEYATLTRYFTHVTDLSEELSLDMKELVTSNDTVYFSLNRYDAFILNKNTESGLFYRKDYVIPQNLIFIAPSDGRSAALTENNTRIYKQIIEAEQGSRAVFTDGKVYIDGEKVETYRFNDDYYWMLSDNTIAGLDSRVLGFIPYKNVIGRATTVIYSSGKGGFRSDRFLMPIR